MIAQVPHDDVAEQAVIAAILVDGELLGQAAEIIDVADFFREKYRAVYRAMIALAADGRPIDLVTIKRILEAIGALETVGGVPGLASMTEGVPRSVNVAHYASIVAERAMARDLYKRASEIVADVLDSGDTAEIMLDRAEQAIFEIGERRRKRRGLEPVRVAALEAIEYLQRVKEGPLSGGVRYGLADLDQQTGGMNKSELVILAARPGLGKSSFGLHVAAAAADLGLKVAFFSMEMARSQLALRLFSSRAQVDGWTMRIGMASEYDMGKIDEQIPSIRDMALWIDDSGDLSLLDMRSKARRMKKDVGLDLIVADYLQLMRGAKAESRQQQVADLSRGLKVLAKELDIPILCLAQLNREVEKRADHRPQLSDLRESGAIEADADSVLLLYREAVHNQSAPADLCEVIVAKQRHGPIGVVKVRFEQSTQRFGPWQESSG